MQGFSQKAQTIFPVFKRVGEDFFEEGSSEYAGNIDSKNEQGAVGVWNAGTKKLLGALNSEDGKKCD